MSCRVKAAEVESTRWDENSPSQMQCSPPLLDPSYNGHTALEIGVRRKADKQEGGRDKEGNKDNRRRGDDDKKTYWMAC